jgi:multidrug resistance efflux pump
MHSTRFRIRTLMIAVAVVALLCWAGTAWWDWYRRDEPTDPFDAVEMVPVTSGSAERSSQPADGLDQSESLEILPTP